jgi:hypothetical protein
MKSKEIFNLAVRLLGLVFLYQALTSPFAILVALASNSVLGVILGILGIVWPLVLAYWLIRGAPLLMRIAYPEPPPITKKDPDWKEVCIQS